MFQTNSRTGTFLDSTLDPDCKFLVGADFANMEQEISGHRAIFANASPVFRNMFFGSIREKGDIKVPDIRPDAFRIMVNFFYTGEVAIVSVEQAVEVWNVADKYDVAELIICVTSYFVENTTPQNVCYILQYSILYRNDIVTKRCHEVILAETSTILNHSSLLETDLSTLSFILDQDELNVSEIDLFRALVRYDNAQKGNIDEEAPTSSGKSRAGNYKVKRAGLSDGKLINVEANGDSPVKDLVKKIRFLAMNPTEFTECRMSSLLSKAEANNIGQNISATNIRKCPMPEGYCTIQQKRKPRRETCCIHVPYEYNSLPIILDPTEDTLIVTCSAKIKMAGVRVLYPTALDEDKELVTNVKYNLTIEVINKRVKLVFKNVTRVRTTSFEDIVFDEPVYIDAGENFQIKIIIRHMDIGRDLHHFLMTRFCLMDNTVNNVTFHFEEPNTINVNSSVCQLGYFLQSIFFTTCD